jgi:hypothetical protein
VVSSLASECGKKENPPVFEKNDDSRKLVNFMNKRQGRKFPECSETNLGKTSNVSSPVQIEDEELVKNQEVSSPQNISSHTMEEPVEKVVEESEKGKAKTDPNLEVSFWKDKYYSVVPMLQENIIDLELENQLLRAENKSLVESQRRQASVPSMTKKENQLLSTRQGLTFSLTQNLILYPIMLND